MNEHGSNDRVTDRDEPASSRNGWRRAESQVSVEGDDAVADFVTDALLGPVRTS